jgi:hypothetical protein
MKKVIAIKDGFYDGVRRRAGETFKVSDHTTGKWFVEPEKFVAPPPKPDFDLERQGAKQAAQSFVTLMKQPTMTSVNEPEIKKPSNKK